MVEENNDCKMTQSTLLYKNHEIAPTNHSMFQPTRLKKKKSTKGNLPREMCHQPNR